jgi:GTP-binding protein
MKKLVALVGRPNVGKSTLFNRLVGKRISITDDMPGVTRDRIYGNSEWLGNEFMVMDMGGYIDSPTQPMDEAIKKAFVAGLNEADVLVFMLDNKVGAIAEDESLYRMMLKSRKKFLVAVNKVENINKFYENDIYDYYKFSEEPIPISASHGVNVDYLLDKLIELFPEEEIESTINSDASLKVSIVGKPNVGKSTLFNNLIGEDRSIVTDIPGTTRDSVNSILTIDDEKIMLMDTAGLRRKVKVGKHGVERWSVSRTLRSIEDSDVSVLMIDSSIGITDQDKKIAGFIQDNYKAVIVAFSKWDISIFSKKEALDSFKQELFFLNFAPVIFITSFDKNSKGVLLEKVFKVKENLYLRVSTGKLNALMRDIMLYNPPPTVKNKRVRIYYASQRSVNPPTFVLSTNHPDLINKAYITFLKKKFRSVYPFEGVPLKFEFVKHRE